MIVSTGRRLAFGFVCGLVSMVLGSSIVIAQDTLSLSEALRIAQANNLTIARSQNALAVAENNNTAGNAGYLPRLDLTLGYTGGLANSNQTLVSGERVIVPSAVSNSLTAGLGVNWTFFDGFSMYRQRDLLREQDTIAQTNLLASQQTLASQVIHAYYDVVQQQQVLDVDQHAVALSQERVANVQIKHDAGKSSKRDLLQAQVDLNADISAQLKQQATLAGAKVTLNQLLNRAQNLAYSVTNTIVVDTTLVYAQLEIEALRNNPGVALAVQNENAARLALGLAGADRYPKLGVQLGYNFLNANQQIGSISTNRNAGLVYGVTASMNLFNGFNTSRQEENARLGIANSELMLADTKAQIIADLSRAYANYRNRITVVALERQNVDIARQNLELANDRYSVGMLIALELRQAEISYVDAQSRLVSALYDAKNAETDLLRISGRLGRP